MRSGFVEASPSRVFRGGEGTFFPNEIATLVARALPWLALLDLIPE
jgi:hypothetical protein